MIRKFKKVVLMKRKPIKTITECPDAGKLWEMYLN